MSTPSTLWTVRGVTRIYFGGGSDAAMPGDYDGDGTYDIGIFRGSSGLWAVRGLTRVYFGNAGDWAIAPGRARSSGGALLRTGQTTSYRPGDDGYYEKGAAYSYTDNGDGTVTDNVTGLMWAKDGNGAGCAGAGSRAFDILTFSSRRPSGRRDEKILTGQPREIGFGISRGGRPFQQPESPS